MTKQDLGRGVFKTVIEKMNDIAKVEQDMKMEGRQLVMVMSKGIASSVKGKVENNSSPLTLNPKP